MEYSVQANSLSMQAPKAPKTKRELIDQAKAEISHTTDGPITQFVLIYRSIEEASLRTYEPSILADALWELLDLE